MMPPLLAPPSAPDAGPAPKDDRQPPSASGDFAALLATLASGPGRPPTAAGAPASPDGAAPDGPAEVEPAPSFEAMVAALANQASGFSPGYAVSPSAGGPALGSAAAETAGRADPSGANRSPDVPPVAGADFGASPSRTVATEERRSRPDAAQAQPPVGSAVPGDAGRAVAAALNPGGPGSAEFEGAIRRTGSGGWQGREGGAVPSGENPAGSASAGNGREPVGDPGEAPGAPAGAATEAEAEAELPVAALVPGDRAGAHGRGAGSAPIDRAGAHAPGHGSAPIDRPGAHAPGGGSAPTDQPVPPGPSGVAGERRMGGRVSGRTAAAGDDSMTPAAGADQASAGLEPLAGPSGSTPEDAASGPDRRAAGSDGVAPDGAHAIGGHLSLRPAEMVAAPDAPAPAAAPAAVADQIVSAVVPLHGRGDGRHEVTLELRPDDLGAIRVEVSVEHQTVHLTLHAADPATGRLLAAALPDLRSALADAGLAAGHVGVGTGGSGASGSGAHGPWADGDGPAGRPTRPGAADDPGPDIQRARTARAAGSGRLDLLL